MTRQASSLTTAALAMLALLMTAGAPMNASAQENSNPTFTFPMAAVIEGETPP